MIQPRIETLKEKKLVGIRMSMSIVNNKTGQLWSSFMPRIHEIKNTVSNDKFSLQQFTKDHFNNFDPNNEFIKWAAIEVDNHNSIPEKMETLVLHQSKYAVFDYKGSSQDPSIFQYIYSDWIQKSPYELDNRPHFEILGEKYRNNDPESEEEIWIPIR